MLEYLLDQQYELGALSQRYDKLSRANQELSGHYHELERAYRDLSDGYKHLESCYDSVVGSKWWTLSKPARKLARDAKQVVHNNKNHKKKSNRRK